MDVGGDVTREEKPVCGIPDCDGVPVEGFTLCEEHNAAAQSAKPFRDLPDREPPPNRPSG